MSDPKKPSALVEHQFKPTYTPEQWQHALDLLKADPEQSASNVSRITGITIQAALKAREYCGLTRHAAVATIAGKRLRIPQAKADAIKIDLLKETSVTDLELAARHNASPETVRNIRKALGLNPAVDRQKDKAVAIIRAMTARGERVDAIAARLKTRPVTVRALARTNGINLHNDQIRTLASRKVNSRRVVEQTVLDLETTADSLESLPVSFDEFGPEEIDGWVEGIDRSMKVFADLRRRLVEKKGV